MGLNGRPASAYRIAKAVRLTVVALLMLILGNCKSNAVIHGLNSGAFIPEAGAQQRFESCGTSPKQSLPPVDFSRAGYRQNDTPVPYRQRAATVSFGPGRYTITSLMTLKSGDVMRGAGRDKTVLYFPKGLIGLGMSCSTRNCYKWSGGVITASGSEIGIEDLTIEFPQHPWEYTAPIETREVYNGIELNRCTNCWVKNVTVRNGNTGIHVRFSSYSTVDGAHVYGNPNGSHMYIGLTASKAVVVINFKAIDFATESLRHGGLIANWKNDLGVFANGTIDNAYIEGDHHCNGDWGLETCVKNTLFSNISGSGELRKIKTDRKGLPLQSPPILWNVHKVGRCPLDVYTVQLEKRR